MKMSCLESALDGFCRKTIDAARDRGGRPMRVTLSQYGRISATGLAERAKRAGLVAHTFGDSTVILRAPKS